MSRRSVSAITQRIDRSVLPSTRFTTPTAFGAFVGAAVGVASAGLSGLGAPLELLVPVGPAFVPIGGHVMLTTVLGAGLGSSPSLSLHSRGTLAMSGAVLSLLCWIVGPLTVAPLLVGDLPTWTVGAAERNVANLVTSILLGSSIGFGVGVARTAGLERADPAPPSPRPRVVIAGGGFGGAATAAALERELGSDADFDVTLVSESNALVFTPLLVEVAGSALDERAISPPLRTMCPRTATIRAHIAAIDIEEQRVYLDETGGCDPSSLPFDHLVLALGSVPNFRDIPGLAEHAFTIKSLGDASAIRNHVLRQLEHADASVHSRERQRRLTFVVAGGGFAGSEMIAELFDLVHGVVHSYPRIDPDHLRFVLVHSRARILPEIGEGLASYALAALRRRGIECELGRRVTMAGPHHLELDGIEAIETDTFIWAAGNEPNPLVASLPLERDERGALRSDEALRAIGHANVWAIGDCAAVPAPGEHLATCPPTAQYAQQQGRVLASNIAAAIRGEPVQRFDYRPRGTLVSLGHNTAVAELGRWRFAGAVGWILWRSVYLAKLPGFERKARVALDWAIESLFPRDIVVTDDRSRVAGSGSGDSGDVR